MDYITRQFFKEKIKHLAERIKYNKNALRTYHRNMSKNISETTYFINHEDKKQEIYSWNLPCQIKSDKQDITALHIMYAELQNKIHVKDTRSNYVDTISWFMEMLELYKKEKQVISPEATIAVGGI